jgi:hypothetical protein
METEMTTSLTTIDWSLCPVLEGKPDTQGGAWGFTERVCL